MAAGSPALCRPSQYCSVVEWLDTGLPAGHGRPSRMTVRDGQTGFKLISGSFEVVGVGWSGGSLQVADVEPVEPLVVGLGVGPAVRELAAAVDDLLDRHPHLPGASLGINPPDPGPEPGKRHGRDRRADRLADE